MDYTDLNEACLKDSFPLSRIDQIIDASVRHGMLSFLDAFSGYHQIPMDLLYVEKTTFITPHGLYCYNVIDAFWFKERQSNLSETSDKDIPATDGQDHGSLY